MLKQYTIDASATRLADDNGAWMLTDEVVPEMERLRARAEKAEARLAEFESDFRAITGERCAPDEQHCSCVPHLRRALVEAQRERDEALVAKVNEIAKRQEVERERDRFTIRDADTRIVSQGAFNALDARLASAYKRAEKAERDRAALREALEEIASVVEEAFGHVHPKHHTVICAARAALARVKGE